MTKKRLGVLSAFLLLFLLSWVFLLSHQVDAKATREFTVPKSYGTFKSAVGTVLVFEDSDGNIRIVNMGDTSVQAIYHRQ